MKKSVCDLRRIENVQFITDDYAITFARFVFVTSCTFNATLHLFSNFTDVLILSHFYFLPTTVFENNA